MLEGGFEDVNGEAKVSGDESEGEEVAEGHAGEKSDDHRLTIPTMIWRGSRGYGGYAR